MVFGDNNRVTVDPLAASLYQNTGVRSAVNGVVRPVATGGIKSLEIRKGNRSINEVVKEDLPLGTVDFAVQEVDRLGVRTDRRVADLRVVRANFEKGKWGFWDGAANFSADITDEQFKRKLDAREAGFYKGDVLTVVLVITQALSPDGQAFQTKYEIEKVLGHKHAPGQMDLLQPNQ